MEILRNDGGSTGRPGVIARVGEAHQPLEQNLELEEQVVLVRRRQVRDPRVAGLRLLAPQAAHVAQQLGIGIALAGRDRSGGRERTHAQEDVRRRGKGRLLSNESSRPTRSPSMRAMTVDLATLPLGQQGHVQRDLAGGHLGDGDASAHHRVVRVEALGRADEGAPVVGHHDEAVLPETLQLGLLELVGEQLGAGDLRQRAVREDDRGHPALRRALELGGQDADLARPPADREPLLGVADELLGLLQDARIAANVEGVGDRRHRLERPDRFGELLGRAVEALAEKGQQVLRGRGHETLG